MLDSEVGRIREPGGPKTSLATTRQLTACWSSQRDRELRVGPPSATGSCVLVLPARQGAVCSSRRCVGPPSATGSCVLVLPARQGAVCSGVLVLPARQGLQPECRVPRT